MNGNNTLVYSIKNPLSFLYNSIEPRDWYTNTINHNDNLWMKNTKSDYDPCPSGWQVPCNLTWSDYNINSTSYYIEGTQGSAGDKIMTSGRLYNHMTWLSAGGSRGSTTGVLNDAGAGSYLWSNNTSDTYATYLSATRTDVLFNRISYRALGLPVRCVQE